MAVSKRLRYEILRRDNHACRYCGACAPDVHLTVDHVVPVALGGLDDPSNLVAACAGCNAGKSASAPDARHVDQVADDALRWAEAMRAAADEMRAEVQNRVAIHDRVDAGWLRGSRPADWTDSIDLFVDAGLPEDIILNLVAVAQNRRGEVGYRWSYFCGCCWRRIREIQDRAVRLVGGTDSSSDSADAPLASQFWTSSLIELVVEEARSMHAGQFGSDVWDSMECPHGLVTECGDSICSLAAAMEMVGIVSATEGITACVQEVARGA